MNITIAQRVTKTGQHYCRPGGGGFRPSPVIFNKRRNMLNEAKIRKEVKTFKIQIN